MTRAAMPPVQTIRFGCPIRSTSPAPGNWPVAAPAFIAELRIADLRVGCAGSEQEGPGRRKTRDIGDQPVEPKENAAPRGSGSLLASSSSGPATNRSA